MKAPRFEIRRGRTGLWRFVLIGANGEIIAHGEHYNSKAAAKRGIKAVQCDAGIAPIVDCSTTCFAISAKRRSRTT